MLCTDELGVHPPGALGVAFFVHAQAECLLGRGSRGITRQIQQAGRFLLDDGGRQRVVPVKGRIFANLLEADALGRTPELVMVCCNPAQLEDFSAEMTRYLENVVKRGWLKNVDDVGNHVPIALVLPNGILAEEMMQTYADQLAESRLLGRLPGVTEGMVTALLDRVVRGIALQAGGRRGSGPDTVYVLEPKGRIVFAGGGERERGRIEAILKAHDYPFLHVRGVPRTRIEFDKAMISIVLNVGGLIHVVRPDGDLIDLRMGDLCKDATKAEFVQTVTRAVFDVGRAVGAYAVSDDYDRTWSEHRATILISADHVTSSVKALRDALADGLNSVRLFPNEEGILAPLIRCANAAGLAREEALFRGLRRQVLEAMARAIRGRDRVTQQNASRGQVMKLTAQRNFTIELYYADADNMVVIGTMLDDDHLVKLEMGIYLPDEQITQSRLDMIRVPFPVCREVESVAERLVGLRIERGVLNEIGKRVGGRAGCSHIKEIATNIIYFAASHLVRRRSGADPTGADFILKPPEERFLLTKDLLRDSCLAFAQTTPRGLDERIGIRRRGEERSSPLPLGEYEASLGVLLDDRARRWGERCYLRHRDGAGMSALTWAEFARRTHQIARQLIGLGIRSGDRVGMISENRVEMYLCELAVASIGAVSVPIFAGYPRAQIHYLLNHAHPRYVVVSEFHQLEKIERSQHAFIERTYVMDSDDRCAAWGAEPFASLLQEGGASVERLDERTRSVRPDDPCLVMYTSGTTGPPKGVQLSHRNLISQQKAVSLLWDVGERDVIMNFLPWHHSFGGLFERYMTLYHGAELCLDDSRGRNLDRLIENWAMFSPTIFCSVPRVHDLLMARCREQPEVESTVFNRGLRFVFTAGAALPADVAAAYRAHNISVLEGWGLTETSPCAALTALGNAWRSGCVGFPIPGVSIRIDADQELLVKGPNVMLGYLNDEDATARAIDEDGWFHTGDLGEFTPDGVRLFGRKDGAFKLTTGEKVHPQRIESVLVNESPFVAGALVLGDGRDVVGALIYPDWSRVREWAVKQGADVDPSANDPAVRALFAVELERVNPQIEVKFQRVRRAVLADHEPTLDRGEMTPSGKLVRKTVMANHKRLIEALFAPDPPEAVIEVNQPETRRTYAGAT